MLMVLASNMASVSNLAQIRTRAQIGLVRTVGDLSSSGERFGETPCCFFCEESKNKFGVDPTFGRLCFLGR